MAPAEFLLTAKESSFSQCSTISSSDKHLKGTGECLGGVGKRERDTEVRPTTEHSTGVKYLSLNQYIYIYMDLLTYILLFFLV